MRRHLLVLKMVAPLVQTEGRGRLHAADGVIHRWMVWTDRVWREFRPLLRTPQIQCTRCSPSIKGSTVLPTGQRRMIGAVVAALGDDRWSLVL